MILQCSTALLYQLQAPHRVNNWQGWEGPPFGVEFSKILFLVMRTYTTVGTRSQDVMFLGAVLWAGR